MRLYIIRHADPDYPNKTLTPAGHQEAQALARRMAAVGLTRLYASPLNRAQQTAQHTADLTKLPVSAENWTRELSEWRAPQPWPNSDRADRPAWDVDGEILRAHEPTHTAWHTTPLINADDRLPEKYAQLQANSDRFLARHGYQRDGARYRIVESNQDQIAMFCHSGFALTWLAHLLALPLTLVWSGFWLAPSSVTTVLFDERSDQWAVPRCLGVGDVSHLYADRLPVQPRGIIANFR